MFNEAVSSGPQFFYLVPWIVLFPVIGLLINSIFGGKLGARPGGERAIGIVASAASGLSFVIAVLLAVSLGSHPEGETIVLARWFQIGTLSVNWAFLVDTLSVTMMLVVSGVGTLIHIYAIGYMHDDVRFQGDPSRYRRFFVFMNLFIAAMMVLVSADNYLMLFVGWEGVGLCSYLLIGFWYDKGGKDGTANATAAKKAFVTNRVGDFGMLLAIFMIFWAFGTLDFRGVFEQASGVLPVIIMAITLFMLIGVTGKSAQIPLFVWLPDAMAGPTPVSALIHAATMVTAGVYLITRSAPLYDLVPQVQNIVALVGAATALLAATIAVAQFDIKKVLAYSTISQLGFMVAAVGMGAYAAGMFHLITHAFFKALLFLGSGSVILGLEHAHHHIEEGVKHQGAEVREAEDHEVQHSEAEHHFDPQDMRNMGGLRTRMRTTFIVYLVGALALAGVFPFAGFWSKDEILAESISLNQPALIMLIIAAFFTAFYMGRQVFIVFFGKPRSPATDHAHENRSVITAPLIALAALTLFGGALNLPKLHTFTIWLEHANDSIHAGEFVLWMALLASALSLLGIGIAWWLYFRRSISVTAEEGAPATDDPLRSMLGAVFTVWENKYWIDELYWKLILNPYIALSKFLANVVDWRFWHDWFHDQVIARGFRAATRFLAVQVDLGIIDGIANGLATVSQRTAGGLRRIQTGYVRNYALGILLGLVIILGYLILR